MSRQPPVIAIDGPSSSGKGTVAARVAARLGWHLLDSGSLYRGVAWAALQSGIDLDAAAALASMTRQLDFDIKPGSIHIDSVDVTEAIREERISVGSSRVARLEPVRNALRTVQIGMRRPPGLVADGRDMGTVVFPTAKLKVFLDASVEERARRRHKQLIDKGSSVSLSDLFASLRARDERDRSRSVSPLRADDDAVMIDTTRMSISAVVEEVLSHAAERSLTGSGAYSESTGQQ